MHIVSHQTVSSPPGRRRRWPLWLAIIGGGLIVLDTSRAAIVAFSALVVVVLAVALVAGLVALRSATKPVSQLNAIEVAAGAWIYRRWQLRQATRRGRL